MNDTNPSSPGNIACAYCEKPLTPAQIAKGRRLCSLSCSAKLGIAKRFPKQACICGHCHQEYIPKRADRTSFCSRDCAFAHRSAQAERRQAERKTTPKILRLQTCWECGESFARSAPGYCSDDCRKAVARRKARERSETKKPLKARRCTECDSNFIPEYGNKHRAFCSDICMRRHSKRIDKSVRRARTKASERESIDPLIVFRAYRWRCALCGTRTPKAKRGTIAADAPELDHIIPLATGGTHTWDNVQCLCRECNQAKGASVAGQLRLA